MYCAPQEVVGSCMVHNTNVDHIFSALLHNNNLYLKIWLFFGSENYEGMFLGGVDDSKPVEDFLRYCLDPPPPTSILHTMMWIDLPTVN